MLRFVDFTPVMDALGWAVLHSIWQGVVALLVFASVRALTPAKSADIRYITGLICMTGVFAAFIGTFLIYFQTPPTSLNGFAADDAGTKFILNANDTPLSPTAFISANTNWIGVLWLMGYALLSLRYILAWQQTSRLRKFGISPFPTEWQDRFGKLLKRAGLSPSTIGLFSEHVDSPMTFGFFKPVVLVPTWFFTGLNTEQCEAILLHEFAHIRRHDYLTNILQIIIKTAFFYHPAIQYISKSIDADREHACDDFAINLTHKPEALAKALGTIRLKSARGGATFALSADKRDTPLLNRLKRLVGTPVTRVRPDSTRAAILMFSVVLVTTMTFGVTQSEAHPHKTSTQTEKSDLAGKCKTCESQNSKRDIEIDGNNWKPPHTPKPPATPFIHKSDQSTRSHTRQLAGLEREFERELSDLQKELESDTREARREAENQDELSQELFELQQEYLEEVAELGSELAEEMADLQEELQEQAQELAQAKAETRLAGIVNRDVDRQMRDIEKKRARLEREIERTARDTERDQAQRDKQIAKIERRIDKLETKWSKDVGVSQSEIDRRQGEIGRLRGEIGRLQGAAGADQGTLGRLYGDIGRLQGELGRLQGEIGRQEANKNLKKYEKMRKRLIPALKADGFMKNKNS
ncbi:MAG TPA: hypothetical protein ENJ42_00565, partial [Hellea balneolensis]|nr:hypothetical protein [Hellea balneolensis]